MHTLSWEAQTEKIVGVSHYSPNEIIGIVPMMGVAIGYLTT